jgi:outer membrane protein, multidrug efflux system
MRSLTNRTAPRAGALALVVVSLAGCMVGPTYRPPTPAAPTQWYATLPHGGDVGQLKDWWSRFDDPLLAQLVDVAQRDSPSIEAALMRIEQARSQVRAVSASGWPAVDLKGSIQRSAGGVPPFTDPRTTSNLVADASWELDLFGGARATRQISRVRLSARELEWHEARISLAADVANAYLGLRTCEALVANLQLDVTSRKQTVDLTARRVGVGFSAPADSALLRASLADANSRLIAQSGECDVLVKVLVALTGLHEPLLREQLSANAAKVPEVIGFAVPEIPAMALSQRPDLAALERELAAASSDINVAEANRYPRISLTGSIGYAGLRVAGNTSEGTSWGFGPALLLPLFDAGRRAAQVDVSRARFGELRALYMQRARDAVREVEHALIRIDAARRRQLDVEAAARDFEAFLAAAQSRWNVGVGNLIELEEARRLALNANAALVQLRRDHIAQWIGLYKALGGGWENHAAHQQ